MKKQHSGLFRLWMRMLTLVIAALALGMAVAALTPPIVGDWQGALSAGGNSLRMVLHVTQDNESKLTGTVDSPDQTIEAQAQALPGERA